jgi:hypothetical protein
VGGEKGIRVFEWRLKVIIVIQMRNDYKQAGSEERNEDQFKILRR